MDDYDEVDYSKIYDLLSRCNLINYYFSYQKAKTTQKRREIVSKIEKIREQSAQTDFSNVVKAEKKRAESFQKYIEQIGGKKNE